MAFLVGSAAADVPKLPKGVSHVCIARRAAVNGGIRLGVRA